MPLPAAAALAIPAVASIASGIFGNRARSKEAQKDRDFQERMRNTEWQAGIADMEKAGVNPALAYSQGGASSPSGAMAQQENIGEDAPGSAMAVQVQKKQVKLLDQQQQEAMARTIKTRNESRVAGVDAREAEARQQYYFTSSGALTEPMRQLLMSRHSANIASSARGVNEALASKLGLSEQRAIAALFDQIGGGGAGARIAMPLILQLMRRGN